MSSLKGSKTEKNLKAAFAGESQANRRYLYFAQKADVEGYNDVAAVFRSTAEGETGHAHGHLEFLEEVGDPATGLPIGNTDLNLKAAIAGETHEYTDMYPGMARTAREEGFDEIADWFETLAKAEKSHAGRFQKALDTSSRLTASVKRLTAAVPIVIAVVGAEGLIAAAPAAAGRREGAAPSSRQDGDPIMSEGSLDAPTRHPMVVGNDPDFSDRGKARCGDCAGSSICAMAADAASICATAFPASST